MIAASTFCFLFLLRSYLKHSRFRGPTWQCEQNYIWNRFRDLTGNV